MSKLGNLWRPVSLGVVTMETERNFKTEGRKGTRLQTGYPEEEAAHRLHLEVKVSQR